MVIQADWVIKPRIAKYCTSVVPIPPSGEWSSFGYLDGAATLHVQIGAFADFRETSGVGCRPPQCFPTTTQISLNAPRCLQRHSHWDTIRTATPAPVSTPAAICSGPKVDHCKLNFGNDCCTLYRVWYYPQFQASVVGLVMHPPGGKEGTIVYGCMFIGTFFLFEEAVKKRRFFLAYNSCPPAWM